MNSKVFALTHFYGLSNPSMLDLIQQLGALNIRRVVSEKVGNKSYSAYMKHYAGSLVERAAEQFKRSGIECNTSVLFQHYPEYKSSWQKGIDRYERYKNVPF